MKMKTMSCILFIVAGLTIFAAGAFGQENAATAIRKVMDDQAVAWNQGNIDEFMKGYWNSEKLVFVSGDRITRGWQPTLNNYKRNYNSRAMMGTLTFSDLEINVLSKDAAVVLGSWSLAREKDNPHGKFTLTFRKFKEGWRIIMDHTS